MNKYTLNWIQWVKPQTRTIGSKTCITTYILTVFSIPLGMELSCFSVVLHLMSLYNVANKRDCLTYFICSPLHFYVDHSLVEFTGSFCGIQGMEISVIKIDLKKKSTQHALIWHSLVLLVASNLASSHKAGWWMNLVPLTSSMTSHQSNMSSFWIGPLNV